MFKSLLSIRMRAILYGVMSSVRKKKGVGKGKIALFALLFLYLGLALGFMFFGAFSMLAEPFYEVGLSWAYFALYGLVSFAIMFIGSVFMTKSQLFEAKDNELLLSLPVPSRLILLSRMASLVLTNCVYGAVAAVPVALAWCMHCPVTGAGATAFVLITLALPLFSVAVSALFGWVLSILSRRMRNKTLFTMAFSLAFLGIYFWAVGNMNDGILMLASRGREIAGALSGVMPLYWMGSAMAGGSALHLLYSLAVLLVPFAIAACVLSRSFHALAMPGSRAKRRVYRHGSQRASNLGRALYVREARKFLSSASYVLNAGLGAAFEVALCVMLIVKRAEVSAMLDMADAIPGLREVLPLIGAVALCFLAGMVIISASSVSIEGKTIWILRSSPVSAEKILAAKMRLHLSIAMPAMLPLQIALVWMLRTGPVATAAVLFLPQAFNFFIAALGLAANLKHPRLDWLNEAQVVKNGLPVVIAMFGGWGAALALGAGGFLLAKLMPGDWALLAAGVVAFAAAWFIWRWIAKKGGKIYSEL